MNSQIPILRDLLLNSSYEPMRIVSWQKALILWFQDKVEVLAYHQVFARSVRSSFQLPSVLRLRHYVKPRSHEAIRFCRENVYIRDQHTCQYCGLQLPGKQLTLDHVVPASQNGPKNWTNIVTACRDCNHRKANRTPEKANMKLKTTPKPPQWLPKIDIHLEEQEKIPHAWLDYLQFKLG